METSFNYGRIGRRHEPDRSMNLYTDDTISNFLDINSSVTLGSDEARRFWNESMVSASPTFNRTNMFGETGHAGDAAPTVTEKLNSLYGRFLDNLKIRTNDSEIFETIKDLIQSCSDTLAEVSQPYQRSNNKHHQLTVQDDHQWLTKERDTWRLLYALYKDRLVVQKEACTDYDDVPLLGSEKEIIEHLYANNANLREYQLIVDWLEQTAFEQGSSQMAYYTDRTIGWENTLLELKNTNQSIFGNGKQMVKSLDPDAPQREKLRLHDLDAEDEKRLSRQILNELRKGRFEDAQALCEHCGQPWKAAALEGWRLHHDPNFESNNAATTKLAIEGNPRRDLWKKIAWMMAEKKTLDECSRAVIGVLCGHLEAALAPLSQSWLDILWVYLKVQIDIRVESEIRSGSMKSQLEMPEKYWNGKMSLEQIFEELSAHENAVVHLTADSPVNIIQKYLILDDIPEMMRNIDGWISEAVVDAQMLRFLTHVVLFMRQVGRHHQEDIADKVIKAYVERLIEMGETSLVAFYTSAVAQELQTPLYAKFLLTQHDTGDRRAALEEALTVGLDVSTITRYTVESVRGQLADDQTEWPAARNPAASAGVTAFDAHKIAALEWLTFYPQQKGELLWQTNAMLRVFLAEKKIECVRRTFKAIPADTIGQIISANGGTKDDLSYRDECSIKELLCYQTYLGAIDGFNDWTRLFHSKPREPQVLASAKINFTERIASEHKVQAYKMELERWNMSVAEQTRVSSDLMYNVLMFPDKGFLVDVEDTKTMDEEETEVCAHRQHQLDGLRKLCIPEVVMLLHNMLHSVGNYKECVRLADELASEKRQLYKVYAKHQLIEIIAKISESSMALMNAKLDPWGYTLDS